MTEAITGLIAALASVLAIWLGPIVGVDGPIIVSIATGVLTALAVRLGIIAAPKTAERLANTTSAKARHAAE